MCTRAAVSKQTEKAQADVDLSLRIDLRSIPSQSHPLHSMCKATVLQKSGPIIEASTHDQFRHRNLALQYPALSYRPFSAAWAPMAFPLSMKSSCGSPVSKRLRETVQHWKQDTYQNHVRCTSISTRAEGRLCRHRRHRVRPLCRNFIRSLDIEKLEMHHMIDQSHPASRARNCRAVDVASGKVVVQQRLVVPRLEIVGELVQDPRHLRRVGVVI